MANHNSDNLLYVKKINVSCMVIAAVLLVLTLFAYSTLLNPIEVCGVSMTITTEELMNIFQYDQAKLFGYALLLIASISMIVAVVNVIRLIISWFGFLGKKDSRFIASKLSKYAKLAFGTIGIILGVHIYTSADDGIFAGNVQVLFILTGIAFAITYLGVRYYRWFAVDKRSPKSYVFSLIKDAMYIAFPLILFALISPTAIGDVSNAITNLINGSSRDFFMAKNLAALFEALAETCVLVGVVSIVKRTLKFLPFDNYKKSAYKAISGKYIPLAIMPFLLVIVSAVTSTIFEYGDFKLAVFTDYIVGHIDLVAQLILATISAQVLGSVDTDDEYLNIRLATNDAPSDNVSQPAAQPVLAETAPVAEESATGEATPAEEPASEETPLN